MRTMLAWSKPCSATTRQATRAISSRRCAWSTIFGIARWYWESRALCSRALVRVEAGVGRRRLTPFVFPIEGAAGEQVDARGHRQPHQHGDVGAAERARHRPLERGAEEGDHHDEADDVGEDPAPVPLAVHSGGIEDLADRVVALAHHVEVDQVDRGPGG